MTHREEHRHLKRYYLLPGVYLLDCIAGDPEWFPHPVRLIGKAIECGESILRVPGQSVEQEFLLGAGLAAGLIFTAYHLTSLLINSAYRRSNAVGAMTEHVLGWTCLASKSLKQEASAVITALQDHDLELSRIKVARIVGRDTNTLSEHEVSRAVIETLAESACDGFVAPLFYMAVGGVPLAMAYKAVNTLDSMIGHVEAPYSSFGKFAARLDDVANFLPARLTAAGIVAASCVLTWADPFSAVRIWCRDGSKHKSPNAGQPESAMSGALQVQLGGSNTYSGQLMPLQVIGGEFLPPTPHKAQQANILIALLCALGVGAAILLTITPRIAPRHPL